MHTPQFKELLQVRADLSAGQAAKYGQFCRQKFEDSNGPGVLIAAHNEEANLPLTLAALAIQWRPVRPIVISNASTDRTSEIAEEMGAIVV